jgi:tetratricopeptide (TPR) repeat protein
MQINTTKSGRLAPIVACSLVLITGGCSNVPKPIGEIASAETAISGAQSSGASEYAPVELDRATSKLQRAKEAVKKENYAEATLEADEALADANLARAKADAGKTKRAAGEMEDSINLLRKTLKLDTTTNQ